MIQNQNKKNASWYNNSLQRIVNAALKRYAFQ